MKTEKEEKENLEIEERKGSSELTKGNRSWRASGGRVGRTSKLLGRLRRRSFDVVDEGSLAAADGRRHFRSLSLTLHTFTATSKRDNHFPLFSLYTTHHFLTVLKSSRWPPLSVVVLCFLYLFFYFFIKKLNLGSMYFSRNIKRENKFLI